MLLVAIGSAPAFGAGFSRAVRLPATPTTTPSPYEWQFAVNDRGQAVAVTSAPGGARVYPLGRRGELRSPVEVRIPGGFSASEESVSISPQGRIALGLGFVDHTAPGSPGTPASSEEPGCCGRVAIATWRLGEEPSPARVISAKQGKRTGFAHQVFGAPLILAERSSITALWTREPTFCEYEEETAQGERPSRCRTQLIELYGRYGGALHRRVLATSKFEISALHLRASRAGTPVADWMENGNTLFSARGDRSGALGPATQGERITRYRNSIGYAQQAGEETVFAYAWNYTHDSANSPSKLVTTLSPAGARFQAPRTEATIVESFDEALAVRNSFLLATWVKERAADFVPHLYARRGTLNGGLGPREGLGHGQDPEAFTTPGDRSVIIYERDPDRRRHGDQLVAITAPPGEPFGRPQRLAARLKNCEMLGESIVSATGYALIPIACYVPEEREYYGPYLIRYSP